MDAFSFLSLASVCGLLFLDQWAALHPPGPRPRPRSREVACRCPFCHQDLDDGTPLRRCVRCATRHHRGCWDAHGGCSVFGCSVPAGRRGPEAPPAPAPAPEPTPEEVALPV